MNPLHRSQLADFKTCITLVNQSIIKRTIGINKICKLAKLNILFMFGQTSDAYESMKNNDISMCNTFILIGKKISF